MIVDGKTISEKVYTKIKKEVRELKAQSVIPAIAVVLIGEDKNSHIYVRNKQLQAKKLGIRFILKKFRSSVDEEKILDYLGQLSQDTKVHGIIVQLPLPEKFNTNRILSTIDLQKDIDNLTGKSKFLAPTPKAILKILEEYKVDFHDKKILLVGRGRLVGRPLSNILAARGIEYEMIGSDIGNLSARTSEADIIISSTGQDNLISQDMIKQGAVVIDAASDVCFGEVVEKAGLITPPKGGIGPLTIAYLLKNTVEAARVQSGISI
ncbi:MAG: bifunctional 5,10-methylenetetrahydrofolate dehydrogenase/5,10-methenyltetrahydrofolate cyclohydrolase [bacterium]